MPVASNHYIDGAWVDPMEPRSTEIIDPAAEEPIGCVTPGSGADVDRAVSAARRALAG